MRYLYGEGHAYEACSEQRDTHTARPNLLELLQSVSPVDS